MKLAPFVIGVISAQGSGDYDYGSDDDRHYGGSSSSSGWSGMGSSSWNYGSSSGRMTMPATAVTCWESNNMGSHNTHHNHMYTMTDEYGWANDHFGHETAKGTINVVNGVDKGSASGTGDYHSALAMDHRLSGCIYEISMWDFTALTYNKKHHMSYGTGAGGVGYDGTNGNIYPVWWHYFNAHVLAGGDTSAHDLVMANPTYEGLGYLNFIVTFLKGDGSSGDAERDPALNDNNLEDGRHTDLYSNGDVFQLAITDSGDCSFGALPNADCWVSHYEQANTIDDNWLSTIFAVSSFPHNDLGKDFRFNLRIMHHLGEGDSYEYFDSYYFYRVNSIEIHFPATVSCPYEASWDNASNFVMHKCVDSAGHNGHHMHDEQFATPQDQVPMLMETFTDFNGHVGGGHFAHICSAPMEGMHACGDLYNVHGLMNMYDEYAQQEYGTHQEIWFQFYYKYKHSVNSVGGDMDEADTGVYNYPNKLFNAFEIIDIIGDCDYTNVFKDNVCNGGAGDGVSEENWSENVQSGR
jgi:hypothetical protein